MQCWAGLGASPGKWGGVGWVRPGPPMPLRPPQSTSVLARKPIGYLSHHPTLWAGGGEGVGLGLGPPPSFPPDGTLPREGLLVFPALEGESPAQALSPSVGKGSSERRVPGAAPALSPHRHPDLKAMRVRVYRNHVQRPEKPHSIPRGKKKLDRNSSIYSVSGVPF